MRCEPINELLKMNPELNFVFYNIDGVSSIINYSYSNFVPCVMHLFILCSAGNVNVLLE